MNIVLTLVILLVILYIEYSRSKFISQVTELISQVPVRVEVRVLPEKDLSPEGEHLEPLPKELIEYIDLESEEWARQDRRKVARRLYAKTQDWNEVLVQLKAEDKID